ncbi:MAG: radical SAM protein [Candidatus Aureabacteria bacterium]|nr:radical SAM protein [Candidatus Auribacterota bacterium]
MISLRTVLSFLGEKNPKIRRIGMQYIADAAPGEAEEALVFAAGNPSSAVSRRALEILKFRQPWLRLQPFDPRPVPKSVCKNGWGKSWLALSHGIQKWVSCRQTHLTSGILRRWRTLPGAVPDLMDALNQQGQPEKARLIQAKLPLNEKQVLLCPTYSCPLDCSYCYAKNWEEGFPRDLSLPGLDLFFKWASRQKVKRLILGGGEPTAYGNFSALLQKARSHDMNVQLTSNLLYPPKVRQLITSDLVKELIAHYHQGLKTRPGLIKIFKKNLACAREKGIPVFLRYTLTPKSNRQEWEPILKMAKKECMADLHYAFSFTNSWGNNESFHYQNSDIRRTFEEQWTAFADDADSMGMKLHLCKPVPLCMLSEPRLKTMLLKGFIRNSCTASLRHFSQNLTVNPDLSTFPCNAIYEKGPELDHFKDFRQAGDYYEPLLKKLLFHPLWNQCEDCLFHYRGFCQGVCLAEHYFSMKTPKGKSHVFPG